METSVATVKSPPAERYFPVKSFSTTPKTFERRGFGEKFPITVVVDKGVADWNNPLSALALGQSYLRRSYDDGRLVRIDSNRSRWRPRNSRKLKKERRSTPEYADRRKHFENHHVPGTKINFVLIRKDALASHRALRHRSPMPPDGNPTDMVIWIRNVYVIRHSYETVISVVRMSVFFYCALPERCVPTTTTRTDRGVNQRHRVKYK